MSLINTYSNDNVPYGLHQYSVALGLPDGQVYGPDTDLTKLTDYRLANLGTMIWHLSMTGGDNYNDEITDLQTIRDR